MKSRGASLRDLPAMAAVGGTGLAPDVRQYAPPHDGFYIRAGKRLLDLVLVIPMLIIFAPVIALAAAAVVLTSGWPAFYRARRVGKDGGEFSMWKLRTMRRDADSLLDEWLKDPRIAADFLVNYKIADDCRVTRAGAFLRHTSLDELPQLINVLRGEMSLVGHRPIVESELVHYGGQISELLSMRPGITGTWQVGGRNNLTYPERATVELDYGHSCGLLSDLSILVRTLLTPLRFNGR
jgi:lipopolysaccharide/colanic/teichoic acid biosynthesis glycosyltransferase